MPPSPLSGGVYGAIDVGDFADPSPVTPGSVRSGAQRKKSLNPYSISSISNSGDGDFISSGPGARGSDGLLSLPSPPQSRSSSAQDSYSTSATNYDEQGDGPSRGRKTSVEAADSRGSKSEGKGNVIVSVRVRPDAGSNEKTDGEWMVDGRRALVSYKGKEGGDHYYGKIRSVSIA